MGSSLIKVRKQFAIFWHYVRRRLLNLNDMKGYPKNNAISLGSGNFFASKTFSPPEPPPPSD